MLSGRGLCDELITRPEESYRLCCVVVCDLETSRMGAPYIYIYIYDISRLRVNVCKKLEAYMFSNWINFILLFMKTDKFGSKVKMGKYSGDCTKTHLKEV